MKKIVLIDGNNLMFRSYYATAYSGHIMKNSKGFPTNALYGFINMMNKIINEEKPSYIAVAFDIGKNFRKQEFAFYKEGRNATPEELIMQMPVARQLLEAMGIKYLELEPYEADDIIGTLVKMCEKDTEFDATIISSDRDLLQLINFETDVKLLKQSDYIRYNEETFKKDYGIDPIRIIDLKALMGDASDNIPGVKGIGEKTALKLLQEYTSLENLYKNIDNIKGSVHDKLVNDRENAFMSKRIATIYKDVPLEINLNDLKYEGPDINKLRELYSEYEFASLIKNLNSLKEEKIKYIEVNDDINVILQDKVALYVLATDEIYTKATVIGACVYDGKYYYYFPKTEINRLKEVLQDKTIITYDYKKNLYLGVDTACADDIMISSYILNYNVKDDIASLGTIFSYNILFWPNLIKENDLNKIINNGCLCTKLIYEINDDLLAKLQKEDMLELYQSIEMPLIKVLFNMEKTRVKVDSNTLIKQDEEISKKLEEITREIYKYAGEEFNISSTRQLGEILFNKLGLPHGKKNKTGYKTDVDTLEKLRGINPIIDLILTYRTLNKLKTTYLDGLQTYIQEDQKIHTIFKQTVARTGRLSSIEPNLQNIPVREEMGRKIREAFIPENDLFLSCDYSQIELRVLAHVTGCQHMIETFREDGDIHAKVAADINGVKLEDVTPQMRSKAKAVIFGIVYGISSYGLMDNLKISNSEATFFINKYYELYPEVKNYMDETIKKARENGFVTTLFKRKRVIDELSSSNYMIRQTGERMAINAPIQGTAADIIKMAMIKIADKFKEENIQSKMVLQVHDELIFDVKKEELAKVTKIVKDIMEHIVQLDVPLKVSSDTGDNWYTTK